MSGHRPDFREIISAVPTSVAVVTAIDAPTEQPCGMTIGSFIGVSFDPPLVLFCIARDTRSHTSLSAATRYCISVLAGYQTATARRFATHDPNRFQTGMFSLDGLPAVTDAVAWLLCDRDELVVAGDHTLAIARVQRAISNARSPLIYHRRRYRTLSHTAGASDRSTASTKLGPGHLSAAGRARS